jgi:hypothetical protein
MKLKDLFEDVAAGSTGAAGVDAFAGRLFMGNRPIKRYLTDPNGKVPVLQYSKKTKEKK